MSGFLENRASETSERSGSEDRVMTWHASRAMLPLVDRIAQDVLHHHQRVVRMQPELAQLERNRLNLNWAGRSRRYQLEEEVAAGRTLLRALVAELETLGVVLLEPVLGLVGFPTMVNDRKAFFSWRPGEESLLYWSYADDPTRNPVPEEWTEVRQERPSRSRSRPRQKERLFR